MSTGIGPAHVLLFSWWRAQVARATRAPAAEPRDPASAAPGGAVRVDPDDGEHEFSEIHARFARNVLGIYLAVSAVALAALIAALGSDLKYQGDAARESLSIETELRAQYLGRYLGLLADEVQRIGARPEIDLLDRELGPERTLLNSYRGNRALFNKGFALLDDEGTVLWSTPSGLFADATPMAPASFALLRGAVGVQMVPSNTDAGVILLASPIRRAEQFTGVLLGVIDVDASRAVDTGFGRRAGVDMSLSTRDGRIVFTTAGQSDVARAPAIDAATRAGQAFLLSTANQPTLVVAGSPVPRTDFVLLSTIRDDALRGPLVQHLLVRLGIGVLLLALPLIGASVILRGSLQRFRAAEDEAIRNQRMRSLGEAASLIAHEVRNSLNSLRLGLDVILVGDSPDRGGRRAEILTSLRGEMTRLADFTTELLTFSRGVRPVTASLDLAAFTTKVVDAVRPHAENREVALTLEPARAPLLVQADSTLIHVVLTNMLSNALDFAENGQPPRVSVHTDAAGGRCVVRVVDNGPGVAATIRPRLFEPFVTGRANGVGIGLALSRRIARAHGGDLRLVPDTEGTCFELSLPGVAS